jgi:hypothetical protein
MLRLALLVSAILTGTTFAEAETVNVKYRGTVDLAPFTCQDGPYDCRTHRAPAYK